VLRRIAEYENINKILQSKIDNLELNAQLHMNIEDQVAPNYEDETQNKSKPTIDANAPEKKQESSRLFSCHNNNPSNMKQQHMYPNGSPHLPFNNNVTYFQDTGNYQHASGALRFMNVNQMRSINPHQMNPFGIRAYRNRNGHIVVQDVR
jgi:hypothetical protein